MSPAFLDRMVRNISLVDKLIIELDTTLRTISPPSQRTTERSTPAQTVKDGKLTKTEKAHSAGLMRVNHSGEVCAQALYQGQALTAQLNQIKEQMTQAAIEEVDHLAWCEQRLDELNSQPSKLNFFWYSGSLILGALAGLAGDKVSLGFVAETEKQVSAHLQSHLQKLPKQDKKTKAIIKQMQEDEEQHAAAAIEAGGIELPYAVKQLMSLVANVMTKSSYYI